MSETSSPERHPRRRRFEQAHLWSSTVTGLVALGLSLYSFAALRRSPEIDVSLPHVLRISQEKDVWVILQPTMSSRLNTEDVEVVTDVRLALRPSGTTGVSPTPRFYWENNVSWKYDEQTGGLKHNPVSDPAPLVVSQSMPQQPVIHFIAAGWNFQPGRYEGTVTLSRASSRASITKRFCLNITEEDLGQFRSGGQFRQFEFRNDVPPSASRQGDCNAGWA
ncbi:hypothetical protein ACFWAP_12210 [Streptomyces goshikiensis]|uniref:hypothetical protein n=1 Tax=Streptomyces goshikiensis TaxID=1942 RepID=UPI00365D572E